MDTAYNTITHENYDALGFSARSVEEIATLRYSFVCTSCREPAYFRRAATSGQGPCFGAQHTDTCDLAVRSDADPWGEVGDDLVTRLEADSTRIVLNLGGQDGGLNQVAAGMDSPRAGGRRFSGGGDAHRTRIQRNPEKLLRLLVNAPSFSTSGLMIDTPHGEIPVHQFFVSMAAANRMIHDGQFRGYWGVPRWTNVWNGMRIFNGAPAPSLGFEMSEEVASAVVQKYRLQGISDLQHRNVLILGSARITSGDSFMLYVPSAHHVAVLPELVP